MMNLWLSCCLLFASSFLSSSAPTPEECQALVKPVSLDNQSVLYGKGILLAGYTDYDVFKTFLKLTDSVWGNISASPASPNEILMFQARKINGTCFKATAKATVEGDVATISSASMGSTFHFLPTCQDCLVVSRNIGGKNIKNFLDLLKIDSSSVTDELQARTLHLYGPELTLTDADLEHFKKQASCLGFTGEPDFLYNPEKSLCQEGESINLTPGSQ